jgi:hypothetical protein
VAGGIIAARGSTDIAHEKRLRIAKANQLTTERLQELARTGAQVTLKRLRAEVNRHRASVSGARFRSKEQTAI